MKLPRLVWILTAIGAVVVGLYIFRKVNPPAVKRVSSGGAGSQNTIPGGYRLETETSVIEIGPATIKPMANKADWNWYDSFDPANYG